MTNCRREREGSRQKSTQVESVTEGRHRKRFVAHRGRRDSFQGAEGKPHFRRLRNSNKSRAFALFFLLPAYLEICRKHFGDSSTTPLLACFTCNPEGDQTNQIVRYTRQQREMLQNPHTRRSDRPGRNGCE